MAFRTPTMPLTCNIFTGPTPNPILAPVPRIAAQACQLRFLKTAQVVNGGTNPGFSTMLLLVNAGTDIRMGGPPGVPNDFVEVPAGSRRFYVVDNVDDVAKGFTNEYRAATIRSLNQTVGTWPRPYP